MGRSERLDYYCYMCHEDFKKYEDLEAHQELCLKKREKKK